MRPRKVVVVMDANEQQLRIRCFLLEVRGFRAIPAGSPSAALEAIAEHRPAALVVEFLPPEYRGSELARRAKAIDCELKVIFVSRVIAECVDIDCVDTFLGAKQCAPVEILEKLRILACRKRGPKKGSRSVEPVRNSVACS
jgi:DNA-binding response OmpR family regulator